MVGWADRPSDFFSFLFFPPKKWFILSIKCNHVHWGRRVSGPFACFTGVITYRIDTLFSIFDFRLVSETWERVSTRSPWKSLSSSGLAVRQTLPSHWEKCGRQSLLWSFSESIWAENWSCEGLDLVCVWCFYLWSSPVIPITSALGSESEGEENRTGACLL